ncbi:PAS domain S-box protein [Nafulsella turpanensis]|uniref:PAS domain S-box protein n=1 Tax=Nafulsella turpanensis TaxID=1265690 RepID=UPI000347D5D4|nr:PAS domain S-box protein [Nafulsella turpanensis]
MLKKFSIGNKITLLVLAVVLLSILAISFITYNFTKDSLKERYLAHLQTVNTLKTEQINNHFQQVAGNLQLMRQQASLIEPISLYNEYAATAADSILSVTEGRFAQALAPLLNAHGYHSLMVLNIQGRVLYASSGQQAGEMFHDPDGRTIAKSLQDTFFSNVFPSGTDYFILAGTPLQDQYGQTSGVLIAQLSMDPIYQITSDTSGLGRTGETLLGKQYSGSKILYLNAARSAKESPLQKGVFVGEKKGVPIQQAVKGQKGASVKPDYREQEALASWDYLPALEWGVVTKIDTEEIYAEADAMLNKYLIAGAIILFVCLFMALLFSRILITPLVSLKNTMQLLGKGVLPQTVEQKSNDEIGDMAGTVNHVVQALKRTANFAHKIGEGHFDAEFEPMSKDDTLGTALITMRDSIQEAEAKDKERNWIVSGVAEIGEILRIHNNLEELGDAVVAYVTQKIGAIQGAFYVVNDDDKEDVYIELKASYAYNKKKYLKGRYRFAEGLVGQSAIEQDTLLRTEIPRDYVTVTSGLLGEQRPDCILIVPLITNEQVYGVMEFAGFGKFTPKHKKFVEEISLITARTVFNIKVNERTRRLLGESQKMSQELQMQQEVLRQNAEEMEATQEELKRTNHRLEEQIDEVNRTQKRMQLLLENASEVITIYEEDTTVRYISPSVERILGYSQDELIGKKDIAYVHEECVDNVNEMFRQLLENPQEQVTIQYQYHLKDGSSVWLEATGTNLLADPAIQGIIVNSRDITERRRAEQEQRMRSQMQALSENSPDLITRLNTQNEFFYINPVIENYTGNSPEELVNKNMLEVNLNQRITEQWLAILNQVREKNEKVATEMEFPSEQLGDRVMQVNAIPEYNEFQEIESVLVVSHDITTRKLIELEIQAKNKKINDSINYAQRIQGAILPDNDIIRRLLPDSFILYKPRDVVSGDFPWFMQVGDDLFIAAVDCTGHGVPGALISLIGYFLLNDIVRSRKISDPGLILDALDAGVTQTLRQDEDASRTKDGMDISLCKINLKKQTLEYAGAHRPLYFMRKGELEEIKGDRFPIGGGKYKNQTNFTSTKIELQPKDAVYFCSDGFPDQFGGPENRKFGPKRLRDLIKENHTKSMPKQMQTVDAEWEAWKGDYKQTDDMLLIGIRF